MTPNSRLNTTAMLATMIRDVALTILGHRPLPEKGSYGRLAPADRRTIAGAFNQIALPASKDPTALGLRRSYIDDIDALDLATASGALIAELWSPAAVSKSGNYLAF